ncbi:MAG: type I polyketide synthase, partial [Verrucomicrobia bacterium]|nr:type I polyketide synthase [Verrucomicrobiota bacterium]
MMTSEEELRWIERKIEAESANHSYPESIAIVGLSGQFPKCSTVEDFWKALDSDISLIEEIPKSRFDWEEFYDSNVKAPNKFHSKWGGFIPNIEQFDPRFFQVLPDEAAYMDPRLRLLLMSVYHTLEDAGYDPSSLRKTKTGVFVGGEDNEYAMRLRDWGLASGQGFEQAANMIANRISYFFDFRGPSELVNTMCSGASIALHRAVCALRSGEISNAVVGAANIILSPDPYMLLSKAGQLSPTNSVCSFGKDAAGHLRSEGVASLLLKTRTQAEADGDRIYAVIKNTAVNYNGQGGTSIAAPYAESHSELIKSCYSQVGIDPRKVGYIESQGMGNPVADTAEWNAFNRALRALAKEQGVELGTGTCRVSTLKPMTGHMESTSALGALFKIIRSFRTSKIHKILNFTEINPELLTEDQPCRLARDTEAWVHTDFNRLAGLHSYGIGGSNAHVLVEEYLPIELGVERSESEKTSAALAKQLIVLSANNPERLREVIRQLIKFLELEPGCSLPDLAYTLQVGREAMKERLAFVASSIEGLLQKLTKSLVSTDVSSNQSLYLGSVSRVTSCLESVDALIERRDLEGLASLWAEGGFVPWRNLFSDHPVNRISLPLYPFTQRRCWIDSRSAVDPVAMEVRVEDDKVVELYDCIEERSGNDYWREYLTFFPFLERVPGFSTSRVALNPEKYPEEMERVREKKIELRQVLFCREKFDGLQAMLDIGCGH